MYPVDPTHSSVNFVQCTNVTVQLTRGALWYRADAGAWYEQLGACGNYVHLRGGTPDQVMTQLAHYVTWTKRATMGVAPAGDFDGTVVDDHRTGLGTCRWANGNSFTGRWARNDMEGNGKLTYADGAVLEANFVRGYAVGHCTYHQPGREPHYLNMARRVDPQLLQRTCGNKLVCPAQRAELRAANARNLEGDELLSDAAALFDGDAPGWCVAEDDAGGVYTGNMVHGVRQGVGCYHFGAGQCYDGQWRDGVLHGRGEYRWPDGRRYVGDFADDRMCGQGRLEFGDGSCFEGAFTDDRIFGVGVYAAVGGAMFDVKWHAVDCEAAAFLAANGINATPRATPPDPFEDLWDTVEAL
jgi:hypothetical protein